MRAFFTIKNNILLVSVNDEALSKRNLLLTQCILVDSSIVIRWTSPLVIIGICRFYSNFMDCVVVLGCCLTSTVNIYGHVGTVS